MLNGRLDLDLALFPAQEDFVFSTAAHPAFVGGFGSGKTEALVKRAILLKLQSPECDIGYFAPTYDLISLIAFPRFENLCDEYGISAKINIGKRIMRFKSGGKIIFRTMENPDRIVGYEIAHALLDELDTLKTEHALAVFNKVLARTRQRVRHGKNSVAVGTTPEGFRFVYDRWKQNAKPGYVLYRMRTADNYLLPEDYILNLQASYPPALLAAYLEGEFVNMTSGSVYPEFNRVLNGSKAVLQAGEPIDIGMDFNIMKMSAVVFVTRDGCPIAVDEITRGRDTETVAETIRQRYGAGGRSITIYPDASGNARKTAAAGGSDFAILAAKGFRVCAHGTNGLVRDRVNAVNAMILNAANERRFKINVEKCPMTTANLEQQVFDKNGEPDKTNDTDHTNDALGYRINYTWPIVKPVSRIDIRMAT